MNLNDALQAREKFLEEHPNTRSYQEEIDRILDQTPEQMRFEVLGLLMAGKMTELSQKLSELKSIIDIKSGDLR